MSSISGGIRDGSTDSSGNAVGGSGNSVAVGGSGDGNLVDYSIGDVSGVVGIAGSHSVGIRKTKSDLGGSVSISFGISFSLGHNVPVVSKKARVSKVARVSKAASVAGVRKVVVGGNNSGGNVGDNGSSVGDSGTSSVGNSGTSSIGNSGSSSI